jgi:aspartyl-tRNA(Asn)/glutamyl-tRNA(Gln) amidotransferase subunit C
LTARITGEELLRVARLAGLDLDSDEEEEIILQLNRILRYMDILNAVETEGVAPAYGVVPLENALREDELSASLPRETALENAPARKDHLFVVPRVI